MSTLPLLKRFARRFPASRPRLTLALMLGFLLQIFLPEAIRASTRLVLSWDLAILFFLGMLAVMMARASQQSIRFFAEREDESAWVILAIVVAAALASMAAIFLVLREAKEAQGWLASARIGLAAATILLSWLLCHAMFALHYAHLYYGSPVGLAGGHRSGEQPVAGGLAFPSEEHPDYWDFLYFSYVIGMTCQVSDVQVTSRRMRRLSLIHGVVAFFFNTVVLALTINLAAGLV